ACSFSVIAAARLSVATKATCKAAWVETGSMAGLLYCCSEAGQANRAAHAVRRPQPPRGRTPRAGRRGKAVTLPLTASRGPQVPPNTLHERRGSLGVLTNESAQLLGAWGLWGRWATLWVTKPGKFLAKNRWSPFVKALPKALC